MVQIAKILTGVAGGIAFFVLGGCKDKKTESESGPSLDCQQPADGMTDDQINTCEDCIQKAIGTSFTDWDQVLQEYQADPAKAKKKFTEACLAYTYECSGDSEDILKVCNAVSDGTCDEECVQNALSDAGVTD